MRAAERKGGIAEKEGEKAGERELVTATRRQATMRGKAALSPPFPPTHPRNQGKRQKNRQKHGTGARGASCQDDGEDGRLGAAVEVRVSTTGPRVPSSG